MTPQQVQRFDRVVPGILTSRQPLHGLGDMNERKIHGQENA
jgi:hypothetical protein